MRQYEDKAKELSAPVSATAKTDVEASHALAATSAPGDQVFVSTKVALDSEIAAIIKK